jgi:hypothetical protein
MNREEAFSGRLEFVLEMTSFYRRAGGARRLQVPAGRESLWEN